MRLNAGHLVDRDCVMALVGAGCRLVLCAECMFQRAVARGVALTLADLQPCMFNVLPRAVSAPRSWYDLFRSRESEPLTNLSEWASFLNRLKRASGVKRGRILARYAHHAEIDGVWSPTADEHPQ